MRCKVVVERNEDRFFIYVPSLPGVIAEGATEDAALANLRKDLAAYLEPSAEDLPTRDTNVREVEL